MRTTLFATFLLAALSLVSGCGGGGGAAPVQVPTVSGVAAAGAAIVGTVTLKDSVGSPALSKSTSDGKYSFDVTGLTKPFLLKVTGNSNGTPYTLYSLAGDSGTANLNPLGNLVLARAAGSTDLAALFAAANPAALNAVAGNLNQALADVQANLKPLLTNYNVSSVDPIHDGFAVGDKLDHLLDLVTFSLDNAGSVTITENGSAPVTISVANGFATHSVSGSVTLDGGPFAGVTVQVKDANGVVYGGVTTASNGSYQVTGIPQGTFTVEPQKTGYSFDRTSSSVTVAASDCDVPAFRSSQPHSISGTVASSNGAGLAGVTVTVAGAGVSRSAITNGNGWYQVTGLANGSYSVTPSRNNVYTSSPVGFDATSKSASVSDGSNFAQANFAADLASYTLSGNITMLSDGAPLAKVALTLVTKSNSGVLISTGDASFSAVSDSAGNFALSGIPSGYYSLTTVLSGYGFSLLPSQTTGGMTADNLLVNGANLQLAFKARPESDATGGVGGF